MFSFVLIGHLNHVFIRNSLARIELNHVFHLGIFEITELILLVIFNNHTEFLARIDLNVI